jgi:hypothetical protein
VQPRIECQFGTDLNIELSIWLPLHCVSFAINNIFIVDVCFKIIKTLLKDVADTADEDTTFPADRLAKLCVVRNGKRNPAVLYNSSLMVNGIFCVLRVSST